MDFNYYFKKTLLCTFLFICASIYNFVFLLVFIFVSGHYVEGYFNSRALGDFARQLNSRGHPDGTKELTSWAKIGVLFGNGNHCDFSVGQVRQYEGEADRVADFYHRMPLKYPGGGTTGAGVFFPKAGQVDEYSEYYDELVEARKAATGPIYILYGEAYVRDISFDRRCH